MDPEVELMLNTYTITTNHRVGHILVNSPNTGDLGTNLCTDTDTGSKSGIPTLSHITLISISTLPLWQENSELYYL